MATDPNTGWSMTPFGTPSGTPFGAQPTQAPLSPQQTAQIQATTAAMGQPAAPANPQQSAMMAGMFGGQGNLGQNLGSMGQSLWGSTPAFGGGNIFGGDAYGGSAAAPIPGLTAADYG